MAEPKGTSTTRKKEAAITRAPENNKITTYTGEKAKEPVKTPPPETEKVDAAKIAAAKAAADAEYKRLQEEQEKKKKAGKPALSPLDIVMGRR